MSQFYKWSLGILQGEYFCIGKASVGLVHFTCCILLLVQHVQIDHQETDEKKNYTARICFHNHLRSRSTRLQIKKALSTLSGSKLILLPCIVFQIQHGAYWGPKLLHAEHCSNTSQSIGWEPHKLKENGILPLGLEKVDFALGPYLNSFSLQWQFRRIDIESYKFNEE